MGIQFPRPQFTLCVTALSVVILISISAFLSETQRGTQSQSRLRRAANNQDGSSQVSQILKLLDDGKKQVILQTEFKDLILLVGLTGTGKSTLTQFLAGDNDQLESFETHVGSGDFRIRDIEGLKIGSSQQSKTIFPELVVEPKRNIAFYDCPGFSDTRSTANDITGTFYTKKVLEHAQRVKVVFVVNHHSVQKGVDRIAFTDLIRHATGLIRNVSAFSSSIGLIATKVTPTYQKVKGGSLILVPDEVIIRGIAEYLSDLRRDLSQELMTPSQSDGGKPPTQERQVKENAVSLLNALLEKSDEIPGKEKKAGVPEFAKIGIFRKPDEAGILSQVSLIQEGKANMEWIIYDNLQYAQKTEEDFGYTISRSSLLELKNAGEAINEEIRGRMQKWAEEIERSVVGSIAALKERNKLEEQNIHKDLIQLLTSLKDKGSRLASLAGELRSLEAPQEFAQALSKHLQGHSNDSAPSEVPLDQFIRDRGNYLDFFREVSGGQKFLTTPLAWTNPLRGAIDLLNNQTYSLGVQLNAEITQAITAISKDIRDGLHLLSKSNVENSNPASKDDAYFISLSLNSSLTPKDLKALQERIRRLESASKGIIKMREGLESSKNLAHVSQVVSQGIRDFAKDGGNGMGNSKIENQILIPVVHQGFSSDLLGGEVMSRLGSLKVSEALGGLQSPFVLSGWVKPLMDLRVDLWGVQEPLSRRLRDAEYAKWKEEREILFLAQQKENEEKLSKYKAELAKEVEKAKAPEFIRSPQITNWGHWGPWEVCPPGMLVNKVRLLVEEKADASTDQTGLGGIHFTCTTKPSKKDGTRGTHGIHSSYGHLGRWKSTFGCPNDGYIMGFTLRSEASIGAGDDTAANNLRILCENGAEYDGDGTDYGDWSAPQSCSANRYFCGIRTQVEPRQGGGAVAGNDDTTLNNLEVRCCSRIVLDELDPPDSALKTAELSASIYEIDFHSDIAERLKKTTPTRILMQAATRIVNNGSGVLTKDISSTMAITERFEVEELQSFSNMHSTGFELSFETCSSGGIPFLTSVEVKTGFKAGYTYERTDGGHTRTANGTETQRSFTITDSIAVPPCTVYELSLFVNKLERFMVTYDIYLRVTGTVVGSKEREEADVETIKRSLEPGLTFVREDGDNKKGGKKGAIVKTTGRMWVDVGLNTDSAGHSTPIKGCTLENKPE